MSFTPRSRGLGLEQRHLEVDKQSLGLCATVFWTFDTHLQRKSGKSRLGFSSMRHCEISFCEPRQTSLLRFLQNLSLSIYRERNWTKANTHLFF